MKFLITRTSDRNKREDTHPPKKGAQWSKASGSRRRGHWFINIKSLEDLIELVEFDGPVILDSDVALTGNSIPSIEIYDDYKE